MPDSKTLFDFFGELSKYSLVLRQIWSACQRQESDADHSFQVAMMLVSLEPYIPELNMNRALKMALIHDLPEVYSGDVFAYDKEGRKGKKAREDAAAKRLFAQHPARSDDLYGLWREFEDNRTLEAKIVQAIDKLQPILHNVYNEGVSWKRCHLNITHVIQRKEEYMKVHPVIEKLFEYALGIAKEKGFIDNKVSADRRE